MFRSTVRRIAARICLLGVVLFLVGGLTTTLAAADEPTTSPPPTSEPAPDPTPTEPAPPPTSDPAPPDPSEPSEPPPSTSPSDPPPSTEPSPSPDPSDPSSGAPAPAPPADAEEPSTDQELPDLRVSASFDKAEYIASDPVRVTVTITNDGPVDAAGVRGASWGDVDVDWGELANWNDGVLIEAGATRVVELPGSIIRAENDRITIQGSVDNPAGDANYRDNIFTIGAQLRQATGAFGGTIFTDHNANGTVDAGEGGLAGVTISLSGGVPIGNHERTTDAQGRFDFGDLPTGRYSVYYSAPGGWTVYGVTGDYYETLVIDDSGRYADLTLPAVTILRGALRVTMSFDQDSYQPGDTARLTVVLVNGGDHTLTGITERCRSFQGGPDLEGGAGWGPLAEGGPGLTIGPRSAAVVQVSEPVPANSAQYGYVAASCGFGANHYPASDEAYAEASARVTGVTGSGRGLVFHDQNSNGSPDPGEGVAEATLAVTDPDTAEVVASPVTDAEGRFAVSDVPAGLYDLRVTGPWKPAFGDSWFRFGVTANDSGHEWWFYVAPGDEAANNKPNLRVSAAFDKPAYNSGDRIVARITVTNIGEVGATGVRAEPNFGEAELRVDQGGWGELDRFGPGTHIEAGATRVFDIPGTASNPDAGLVTFASEVTTDNGEINLANNRFRAVASVTKTTGNYAGVVYADANYDGVRNPDEEVLPGAVIHIFGGVPISSYEQTTNEDGRFAFEDIPTGPYSGYVTAPGGWEVPSLGTFVIDEQDDPDVEIRAVRPLEETMRASIRFEKDAYRVGDTARLRVTLTNTGSVPIERIKAWCNHIGNSNGLNGVAEGWGPLRYNADGVTVAPGETRIVEVTDTVPSGAGDYGYVAAACGFGPDDLFGNPGDFATANIIGKKGKGEGRLTTDRDGDGDFDDVIADTKVVLIDRHSGTPVAKTRTNAEGDFEFAGVPANVYELRVVGPWQAAEDEDLLFFAQSNEGFGRRFFRLVPGPNQPDPFPDPNPQPPATAQPLPQGSVGTAETAEDLASTGASVVGLAAVSLGLLVAGLGAVALSIQRGRTRRRLPVRQEQSPPV